MQYESSSKEICEWNFGNAEFNEKYTTTCNPGFIYFLPWVYRVSVKVSENGMSKWEKHLDIENIFLKIREQNNLPPKSKITLQSKLSSSKISHFFPTYEGKYPERGDGLSWDKIICKNVDKCYLNLTWEESSDFNDDKLTYKWNLGNGTTFDWENPKGVWYNPWKYSVSLEVTDIFWVFHQSSFSIEVIGTQKKDIEKEEEANIEKEEEIFKNLEYFKNLQIKSVLVNPKWKDSQGEYIELENIGFTPIDIKWITLDDILEKWSKPFKLKESITLWALQSYKVYRTDSKIALNNGSDTVHISYYDEPLDSLSRDFSVPEDYVLTKKDTEFLEYEVKVLRVIDGDTILIQFEDGRVEKLRLVWVDTPETKHPKKPVEFFWKEASNFTKEMLEWKQVILKQSVKNYRDKYNRLLGYVYVREEEGNQIFFNKLLIEQWYARAYLRFPFEYLLDFKKAENKAKRDKQWMWTKDEVRKEVLAITREERKLEPEQVKKYKKTIDMKNIKVWEIVSSIQGEKEEVYREIEQIFTKKYRYLSQVWSQENAKIREKKLPKQKNKTKNKKQEEKKKKIRFTKTIVKQKKSLKISWKTLPNTKIIVSWIWEDIVIESDELGAYSAHIHTWLYAGQYNLSFFVENNSGEIFAINRDKELVLEEEYLQNMKKYYIPKAVKQKEKRVKEEPKKDDSIIESSWEVWTVEEQQSVSISTVFANILTTLVVIWLLLLILRKEKII